MPGRTLIMLLLIMCISNCLPIWGQTEIPRDFCLNSDEMLLLTEINQLRADYGKDKLQLSASLSFVAKTHVADLLSHHPDTSICNLSSWSDQGSWKACCFNSYIPNPECMWGKPKELTPYPYRGYELVTYFDDIVQIDSVIAMFSDTKEVLNMILNQEDQGKKKWVCCGIGINDHYVSVWFGQRRDALAAPKTCDGNENSTSLSSSNSTGPSAFYLIFGSYNSLQDAKMALKKLKKNDFSDAGILNKNGKVRVYLSKYDSLKEATFAVQKLPLIYREAWILKD